MVFLTLTSHTMKINHSLFIRALVKLSLFIFYPLINFIIIGWFLIPFIAGYFKEILGFSLFSILFFIIFLLIKKTIIKKWWLFFSLLILNTIVFIKLSFYYLFGVKITSSAIFVVLETNLTESSEFLSTYINALNVILLIVLVLPVLFLIWSIYANKKYSLFLQNIWALKIKSIPIKIILVLIFLTSVFGINWKFKNENFLFTSINSYKEYQFTKKLLKNNLAKEKSEHLNNVENTTDPQTYVVIIGESTSKWHLQLYGYQRKTNPLLSEIKSELFVFNDVITPNVHTITALEKILTLSDIENPNKKLNASVVQLANQAGFETYWISNQKPVGLYESIPTLIGSAAKNKNFIATDNYNYNIYDEDLLPYFDKALNETKSKKIIFIHLIGTHNNYYNRYPENFNIYKNEFSDIPFKHKKSIEIVNTYDNAILYNDFIVRSIIDKVKNENLNSYVMYFSDHGDEVYDTMDFMGHNEYHGTKPMYDIPFILWLSKKYKIKNPEFNKLHTMLDKKYSLENFIYSFSEISNIKFDSLNLSKSLFNKDFIYRPRIIKNAINYDSE